MKRVRFEGGSFKNNNNNKKKRDISFASMLLIANSNITHKKT